MGVAENTRARIRLAAADLIKRVGAANLTLAGVAETAGISKGGLLYHYPSKQALLEGMLEHLLGQREQIAARHDKDPIALLEAIIDTDFDLDDNDRIMGQAILAASAADPELLSPARIYISDLYRALQGSEQARAIMLATQGLQLLEMLGLLSIDRKQRNRLRVYLKQQTRAMRG